MATRKLLQQRTERLAAILPILHKEFPRPLTALNYNSPFELLVATILSAQCTDERVNMVTPALFKRYPTLEEFANADQTELEQLIFTTGFYRNKAKSILGAARVILEDFKGELPRTLAEFVKVPGAGRKTASVVLGSAFGIAEGIVVDTHVARLSKRLGLTKETDPVKVERDLIEITPKNEWISLSHLLILHGRATCVARKPKCEICRIAKHCPSAEKHAALKKKS